MKKNGMIFLFGCCVYPTIEMLWRGRTHTSMALAGGICMVLINRICCEQLANKRLSLRCAAGSAVITGVELIFGIMVNRVFHLGVWDYSHLPLNFFGQVCLPFSIVWYALTAPACAVCRVCARLAEELKPGNVFLKHRENADLVRGL